MQVFYIDPQSYNNLSIYDTSLMDELCDCDIHYYHNVKYQCEPLGGVHYHPVFSYSDKHGVGKAVSYCASILRIAFDVVRYRPKVAHIQWFRVFYIDSILVLLMRLIGVRVVHTAHNVLPHNPAPSDRKHYAWFYRHVDSVIVHTQRSKDQLVSEFGISEQKVHVIPHGMLPSSVDNDAVEKRMVELREKMHLDGKLVFASMGYQNYYKGIDIISDVWMGNESLAGNPACQLLVVGKVENADVSLLKACPNVLVMDEMVSDIDFDAFLRLADVALLPYRNISQSGVLLTALQRGVPVVVSDVGGLTEPLRYGEVGWNIGEPNVENLEKTMMKMVSNPEGVTSRRKDVMAFDCVREMFSWSKIGKMTSVLYKSLSVVLLLMFSIALHAQNAPVLLDARKIAVDASASRAVMSGKMKKGDEVLAKPLLTVVSKTKCFSGDIHNYESLAYYAWPDESNPNGPWKERDGQPSPEYKYYDGETMTQFDKQMVALFEAYAASGEERHAERMVSQLDTWFIKGATRMNPNLTHGQFIPGRRNGMGHTGAISEAYFFTDILDCIAILQADGYIDRKMQKGLEKWFKAFSKWLRTSELGHEMHNVADNHAVMYDLLLYRVCLFTGEDNVRRQIRDEFATLRLNQHIAPDGSQPRELKRTKAMMYSIYNLKHMVEFCRMAQLDGVDYYGQHRERIDAAFRFIERYIDNQKAFPYKEIGDWSLYQRQFAELKKQYAALRIAGDSETKAVETEKNTAEPINPMALPSINVNQLK